MIKLKRIVLLLAAFSKTVYCQLPNEDDLRLAKLYKVISGDYSDSTYGLAKEFKREIKKILENPSSFQIRFDSLSKFISIVTSIDKKLRVFSWDEMDRGSRHSIVAVAQYLSQRGAPELRFITPENDDSDGSALMSIISKVELLINRNGRCYLTIGWGTLGGGMQHLNLHVYKIIGRELVDCKTCFPGADQDGYTIQWPRAYKADLKFDSIAKSISYNEYPYIDSIDSFSSKFNRATLEYKNGKYLKRK